MKNELKETHESSDELDGPILWREFYYINASDPNYDKMVGNRICKQIPWKNDPETSPSGKVQTGFLD